MGLSSSQARLLTLTGRMHDIEYKAQKLEAQKLMLANKTRQVYEGYLDALEAVKIQNQVLEADGSISYTDTTYNKLVGKMVDDKHMYIVRDVETGKAFVSSEYKSAYDCSNKTLDGFLRTLNDIKSGASASYTSITTAAQLKSLSNSYGNFRLDADITVTDWDGIDMFHGVLDGNGHTITIQNGTCGLFYRLKEGSVKNVNVDVNISTSDKFVGGLAGVAYNANIENCSTTGNLSGRSYVGGLVGYTMGDYVNISNSESSTNVYANYVSPNNGYGEGEAGDRKTYAGGFIGYAGSSAASSLTVTNCTSNGDVKAEYWYLGGFIGKVRASVTLNNCVSNSDVIGNCNGNGDVYAGIAAGGVKQNVSTFIGDCDAGTVSINNCNANGKTSANGNPDYSKFEDVSLNGVSPTFNNFYSKYNSSANSVSSPNVYIPDTDPSHYPNLSSEDIEKAKGVFALLDQTKGGVVVPEGYEDDSEWFTNMVIDGQLMISLLDVTNTKEYSITDVSVATDTNLREIPDETNLKKVEAQYEADMRKIDLKDRKYDTDLAALDAERNAIKQEMETLKTVAKENVERTFRLFS